MPLPQQQKEHAVSFVIPPADRPLVSRWLADVRRFFATTAEGAADLSKHFAGGAPPAAVLGQTKALTETAQTDDVLEGVTVHYAVHISSLLGHCSEEIRVNAVFLLFELACIFDKKAIELKRKLGKITLGFQTDDRGFHTSVNELFHYIGPALSTMAIAFVAGLECFFTCSDWSVRGICISVLTRLVYENDKVFLEEDHLAAVYNLYFSLGSIPLISKIFPDRIVIIKALGLLSPLYAVADVPLAYSIVGSLLQLQQKTALEVEAIKLTVKKIFDKLCESSSLPPASAGGQLRSTPSCKNATPSAHSHRLATAGYNLFLNMLTPNSEYSYDLLTWALQTFSLSVSNTAAEDKNSKVLLREFSPLTEFINGLANHFRATPSLVRYGACICLHAALNVFPSLLQSNRGLLAYIISGVLDSDYLSSFLYLSMLEKYVLSSAYPEIRAAVSELRRESQISLDFDTLYLSNGDAKSRDVRISDVLDASVSAAPPLAPKLLHKMANSLEYLGKTARLRQMELIRIWTSKLEKFDTYLMQTLVPLLNDGDEGIQMAAVRVLYSLLQGFKTAPQADIAFTWAHLKSHLHPKVNSAMIHAILELVKVFPLERLNDDARVELLSSLIRLTFHKDVGLRLLTYEIIGEFGEFWKSCALFNAAIGVLFLAIGDQSVDCAKKVIDYLCALLQATPMRSIIVPLGLLKDKLSGSVVELTKAYDDLANNVERNRAEFQDLISAVTHESNVDEFWNFFLFDVPEHQLVRPDEYSFSRNFIHGPFWVATLLAKLGVSPPPLSTGDASKRNMMPNTPANKRRFICGFMLLLLPTCGMPDPLLRRAACLSTIFCCHRQNEVVPGMLRGLLDYISQQMLSHKQWTFQLSAMDVLRYIVRLKLPGVSPAVLLQYLDLALDMAFNSPSSMVKVGSLKLIEAMLLVFPSGISSKLQDVRDVVRALIVGEESDVVACASRIYPLIFRCVATSNTKEFHDYLRNEISVIQKGGLEAAGDPLISALKRDDIDRVLRLNIVALGAITSPSSALTIVQELLNLIKHDTAVIRHSALSSILTQLSYLDGIESSTILWILLPLYADPYPPIRLTFSKYLRRGPTEMEAMTKDLSPHADDSYIMSATNWEELLLDGAVIHVSSKNLSDLVYELDDLAKFSETKQLPLEDDGFHIPKISEKLLARFKALAKSITGVVPGMNISEVIYHLQQFGKCKLIQPAALLVLSEFACVHESCQADIIDMLISNVNADITPLSTSVIEASILGLKNVSEFAPIVFKQLLAKITAPVVVHEGDLACLFYRIDAIREFCSNKVPDLLKKYVPLISSQRQPVKKRMYAVHLSVELSMIAGQDEMVRVLDAIQSFLDITDEEELRFKVYGSLGKILGQLGGRHAIFKTLLGNARRDMKHKEPTIRARSLKIFRIFAKFLSVDESLSFAFLYLADSNQEVRKKAREIMMVENILDFTIPGLKATKSLTGTRRAAILEACKLPSIQRLGVTINTNTTEQSSVKVPLPNEDPFNHKYFSSDRRRKFTNIYRLPDSNFARAMLPVTQSVLDVIDDRASGMTKASAEMISKNQWLLGIDTISILHECMKRYPQIAVELIDAHMDEIESVVRGARDDDGEEIMTDIETEIHTMDVLANLLFAFDGIDDRINLYIDRLQSIINECNEKAASIRESLYIDLESTFYFFNEYVDVPIVSEEQFEALESFKSMSQEATLEIVKSGKTDMLSSITMQKNELNEVVDAKSEQLRRLTIIALHGTSGFGLYHALSQTCPDSRVITSIQFLAEMLENEHRGIRMAAVEAIGTIARIQFETTFKAPIAAKMQSLAETLLTRVTGQESSLLYRRKADMINVLAEMILHVNDKSLRAQVVRLLISLWWHQDSEVRITAIKMVQYLGESGIEEVLEGFHRNDEKKDGLDIMKEVVTLLSNEEFMEKDHLNTLLTWRFAQKKTVY